MKKAIFTLFASVCFVGFAISGELPRGTFELKDVSEAKAKAATSKKLIAYLYTKKDTTCPLCVNAVEEYVDTVKSKAVLVYVDREGMVSPSLPESVKKALAAGTYIPRMVVTDAGGENVVASIRYEDFKADSDKALRAFKKELRAKK